MFRIVFCLVLLLGLGANAQPKVVVTTPVLHSLAAQVMQGVGSPSLLLEQPFDAHHLQLRPSQLKAALEADLLLFHHPLLESFMPALLPKTTALALVNSPAYEWLAPDQVIISLQLIAKKLAAIDPKHAEYYYENAASAQDALGRQALRWSESLQSPAARSRIFSDHPAFEAFTRYFALREVAALEDAHGNLRPAQLKSLSQGSVSCLFATHGESRRMRQLASASGAKLTSLNPLGYGLAPGPDLYTELLTRLVKEFAGCLTSP